MTSNNNDEDLSPLFSKVELEDEEAALAAAQAEGEFHRDQVRAIFEHFDLDGDKHLKFVELATLQKATSGTALTEDMYVMACKALDCHPGTGISLDALKLTYAAEGSNLEKDYYKVFPDRKPKKSKKKKNLKEEQKTSEQPESEEDKVYEIGSDGTIDISS